MKRTYEAAPVLTPPTDEVIKAQLALLKGGLLDALLVICLSAMVDIAEGHNVYVTFGATRDQTAYLVTLSEEGRKYYAAGPDLATLADSLRTLASS